MALQLMQSVITTIAAGQLCQNVTHWQLDITPTNLYQSAKKFNEGFQTDPGGGNFSALAYSQLMSEDAFISSIASRVLKPNAGLTSAMVFSTGDFPGQRAEDVYSQSVAAVMRLFTPAGTDYTGRAFVPGIAAADILEGRFTNDFITASQTLATAWVAGVESSEGLWKPAIARRPAFTFELVTGVQLAINPGTIRRRLIPV